jgi:hypothetical protein
MLAAGLLAAATVLATAGAASAGPTPAHHRITCSGGILTSIYFTQDSTRYFPGVPNNNHFGATVRLKPLANGTTTWCFREILTGPNAGQFTVASLNGGLAMTSRATSPGTAVTVETNNAFASQRWILNQTSPSTLTLQNVKTTLFLRIRNSGPIMYQTVTTGAMATNWTIGIA